MAENFNKIFNPQNEPSNSNEQVKSSGQVSPQAGEQYDLFAAPGSGNIDQNNTSERKSLSTQKHWYQIVNSKKARELLLKKLLIQKQVCFDTETTSINALKAELIGISFSWKPGKGYYLSLPLIRKRLFKF
jgi:DNA polymerase-1